MSLELTSNLKYITSGNVPTTSTLANGELAFGLVNGVAKLYGNVNGTITDLTELATPVTSVAGRTGDVILTKSDVGLSNVPNVNCQDAGNLTSGYIPSARIAPTPRFYSMNPVLGSSTTLCQNLGGPTLAEMAVVNASLNDKLRFYDITKLGFEYLETSDGEWTTDSRITDTMKRRFVAGLESVYSGITIANGWYSYRITIECVSYIYLNYLYMYTSTNGNRMGLTIEGLTGTGDGTWRTISAATNTVGTWPGHIWYQNPNIAFSPTNTSQYRKVRLVFRPEWAASNTNVINLHNIQWFGGYPAGNRHLYSWDEYKNAYFPGNVYANSVRLTTLTELNAHTGNTNNPHGITAAQTGAVPTSRTINSKALTSDITLTYGDVGAAATSHTHSAATTSAAGFMTPAQVTAQNVNTSHRTNTSNPHSVTKAQVGLGSVDNTSDVNKPVSTAQAAAIKVVQDDVNAHETNTSNPHGVTKAQVGLTNVANVLQYSASNPPPYPVTSVAGKTGVVALTKDDVGLSNVDNTADGGKWVYAANTLNELDTRTVNSPPSYYMSFKGQRCEFKNVSTIGVTMPGRTFCMLITYAPWTDSSGGLPVQIATATNTSGAPYMFSRSAISESEWGAWYPVGGSSEPYVATLATSSWSGSSGNYTYIIDASTHGKGLYPTIHTYNISGSNYEETYDSPIVDASGNVTLYSNAQVAMRVVIT